MITAPHRADSRSPAVRPFCFPHTAIGSVLPVFTPAIGSTLPVPLSRTAPFYISTPPLSRLAYPNQHGNPPPFSSHPPHYRKRTSCFFPSHRTHMPRPAPRTAPHLALPLTSRSLPSRSLAPASTLYNFSPPFSQLVSPNLNPVFPTHRTSHTPFCRINCTISPLFNLYDLVIFKKHIAR